MTTKGDLSTLSITPLAIVTGLLSALGVMFNVILPQKFAKEYVAYEEELKEVKERFKRVKEEYAALGVNTRAVIKSVKKIAKSFKISKTDADDEERLEGAIRGDTNLFSYIEKVMI